MNAEILYAKKIDSPYNNEIPLLIFHGLFGMLDNWQTLAFAFAEKIPVYLVDLRNHGRSFHADEMSYDTMSEDILNFITFHGLEEVHLLGHSLGGKAVMQFALQHSNKVSKLIVADIAPKAYPAHHQSIIKALQSVDFAKIFKRSEVESVLAKYIPEIGVRQFLLKSVYRKDDGYYDFRFNLKSLSMNYNNLINNTVQNGIFEKPTLFLKGEKSEYILSEDFPAIQLQFPNSSIKTIFGAGHWLHAENPENFAREVMRFLD